MPYLLRGALIEYKSDFFRIAAQRGNFSVQPRNYYRAIQIPPRPTGGSRRETSQAGDPPLERITLKAEFDAADYLNTNNLLAREFGVEPQLAALEKMVFPSNKIGAFIGQAIDAVGDALGIGGGGDSPCLPIPREQYPRILFIWGRTRILIRLSSIQWISPNNNTTIY